MECSFSLFIPFRFHIHTEAGYNPVGRYGFVFSPRWQNEGIEKKERAFRDCARSVEAYSCALYTEDFGGRL